MFFFFWVFSSNKLCEKKRVQELIWATARTVSQYNGTLYRDMALWMCSRLGKCIAIGDLYCNMGQLVAGKVCRNTPIVL